MSEVINSDSTILDKINVYSIAIFGNGLDIALGKQTKINDFLNWLKSVINSNAYNKLSIAKTKFDELKYFLESYENWLSSNKKLNENWSNIENDIIEFFTEFELDYVSFLKKTIKKISQKDSIYKKLKIGYEVFCFSMQYYYFNEINQKASQKANLELEKKLSRLNTFCNNYFNEIISLNYTSLADFIHPNSNAFFSTTIGIHYLHYIAFGTDLFDYVANLYSKSTSNSLNFATFGSAPEILSLKNFSLNKSARVSYSKPQIVYKKTNIQNKDSEPCAECNRVDTITTIGYKKYYQLLILGTTNTNVDLYTDQNYNFLFKNESPNLFLNNYPLYLLQEIYEKIKFKLYENEHMQKIIFIFGYSFGESDYQLNNFILKLLKEHMFKIYYLFFKEDQNNNELITANLGYINKFRTRYNMEKIDLDSFLKVVKFI
ncbi:hypothetical protein [Spiroplasma sp. DGKH1]|uniref:hypothetical protein n=1 Tax=Spiroplasma sp. DGKH1 TaxID=3050074 RepID=UPI0034C6976F